MIKIEAESKDQFCRRVAMQSKIHSVNTIKNKTIVHDDFWVYTDPEGQTFYADYVDHLEKLKKRSVNRESIARLNPMDNGVRGWIKYRGMEKWSRRCLTDVSEMLAEKLHCSPQSVYRGMKRSDAGFEITCTFRGETATIVLSKTQTRPYTSS